MERLFKVTNVFRDEIDGKTPGTKRQKAEITLCYHETYYSSQSGPGVHKQYEIVSLLDDAATNCQLQPGQWVVASISKHVYDNPRTPGRQTVSNYMDRYIPISDWNVL